MSGKAICTIDNCTTVVNGHGLCQAHQLRLAKGQDMNAPKRAYRTAGCAVEGCDKPHHGNGYCRLHYLRDRRTGGQRVLDDQRWPRKPDVGYHAVHKRLWRDIGHPTTLTCVDCGGQGEEWSYIGGCPDEQRESLQGRTEMAYCTHQHHYEVRCVTCHKRYDGSTGAMNHGSNPTTP